MASRQARRGRTVSIEELGRTYQAHDGYNPGLLRHTHILNEKGTWDRVRFHQVTEEHTHYFDETDSAWHEIEWEDAEGA